MEIFLFGFGFGVVASLAFVGWFMESGRMPVKTAEYYLRQSLWRMRKPGFETPEDSSNA